MEWWARQDYSPLTRLALRAGVEDAVLSHRCAMLGSNLEPRDYENQELIVLVEESLRLLKGFSEVFPVRGTCKNPRMRHAIKLASSLERLLLELRAALNLALGL